MTGGDAAPPAPPRGLGEQLLLAVTALLAAAAATRTVLAGVDRPGTALAFGGLIALGELLRLGLPGGRESAPVAIAGGLSYALLLRVGTTAVHQPATQIIAVTAAGMVVGALPHLAAGRPARLTAMASRLLTVAIVALTFRPLSALPSIGADWWPRLAVTAGLLLAGGVAECGVRALTRARALHARIRVALADELRVQFPLGVAVAATAILIAAAARTMGLAALAVFVAPLLVTQVALRRYAGIKATYLETVRALARVTEVGGYVEDGHAHRVAGLAVAIGRELGMGEAALLDLEYAALMHDIGQLSLAAPIPGGATVLASPADQAGIAELGAAVIAKAGVLDAVAEIVRCQAWPWRGAAGEPPVGSRVIRAANAYDDLVGTSGDAGLAAVALDRLRLGAGTEYDPAVVSALSQVAGRVAAGRR